MHTRSGSYVFFAAAYMCGCQVAPCLFDLDKDPLEQHNVALKNSSIVTELRAALEQFNATAIPDMTQMGFDPASCPKAPDFVWMPWK